MATIIPNIVTWSIVPQKGTVTFYDDMNVWLGETNTVVDSWNTSLNATNIVNQEINDIYEQIRNADPTSGYSQAYIDENYTKTLDTLADLRALNIVYGSVKLSGYYTKNDGAFGDTFYRLKGLKTSEVDNGGTTIVITVNTIDYVYELQYSYYIDVKWFGAVPKTEASTEIQNALDNEKNIIINDDYNLTSSIFPKTGNNIMFRGKLTTTSIISGDECAIKLANCTNVNIYSPYIDVDNKSGNSGIIIRENVADIYIENLKFTNGKFDVSRGGGRGLVIEANTGTSARIIVNSIRAYDSYQAFAIQGYTGTRKNNIIINNIVANNCEQIFALFGNGAGYPHSADSQSCVISNITANSVGKSVAYASKDQGAINFSRGANAVISNVQIFNPASYGKIGSIVRGQGYNIALKNIIMEGAAKALYNGNAWDESGFPPDIGVNTIGCNFELEHIGIADEALVIGYTGSSRVNTTEFKLRTDVVTSDISSNSQFQNNSSAYIRLYNRENNAILEGFANKLSSTLISSKANKDFAGEKAIGLCSFGSSNMIPDSNNQYTLGSATNRFKDIYSFNGFNCLAPNGNEYKIGVDSSGNIISTLIP